MVLLLAIIFVLTCPSESYALLAVPTLTNNNRSSPWRRLRPLNAAFGGIIGNKETQQQEQLPKDIKDAVTKCQQSVQKALSARISRMEIEMPVGANFGIEDNSNNNNKQSKKNKRDYDKDDTTGLTMTKLDTSNRELARLFVEMFQPLGGSHICAIYNTEDLANEARLRWSNNLAVECNIVALDRKGRRSRKGSKPNKKVNKGFAAILAEELDDDASGPFTLPKETEVAIFIAPGPKELIAIERICNDVGMGTCIILLNARLSSSLMGDVKYTTDAARTLFTREFEPVWTLTCAPQDVAPGCLLHRAYPGPWILARKPKVGPPKTIATKKERFSMEEYSDAYSTIEISELEKTSEKFAENVMGWFK
jgi:hypothetical protein